MNNTEILKLHEMLTEANIPHLFDNDMFGRKGKNDPHFESSYQIVIKRDNKQLCDCIYHWGSYGYDKGLLEIMGALTLDESQNDGVLGYLTAEEVFKRFKFCYENNTSIYEED